MNGMAPRQRNGALCEELRTDDERFVPFPILFVPFDELANALADVTAWLVINQIGGFRDIGVGVFGVAIADLGVLDIERRINLVADDFGERGDVDIIG